MRIAEQLLDYVTPWTLPDVVMFTGNPIIKKNEAIVMGRGAARTVRDTWPGADIKLGQEIRNAPNAHLLWIELAPFQYLGWFKVKHHWAQPADIELIKASIRRLKTLAEIDTDKRFHLNFPGIGNGRLSVATVMPHLETLPDNVIIYRSL